MVSFDVPSYDFQNRPFEKRYKHLLASSTFDHPFNVYLPSHLPLSPSLFYIFLILFICDTDSGGSSSVQKQDTPGSDGAQCDWERGRRSHSAQACVLVHQWSQSLTCQAKGSPPSPLLSLLFSSPCSTTPISLLCPSSFSVRQGSDSVRRCTVAVDLLKALFSSLLYVLRHRWYFPPLYIPRYLCCFPPLYSLIPLCTSALSHIINKTSPGDKEAIVIRKNEDRSIVLKMHV